MRLDFWAATTYDFASPSTWTPQSLRAQQSFVDEIMKLILLTIAACLSLTLGAGAAEDVVISEFMASNTHTLADENGSFEDWIEISNSGLTPVNLGGWFLTDSEG